MHQPKPDETTFLATWLLPLLWATSAAAATLLNDHITLQP
jgi:hypothetical protein